LARHGVAIWPASKNAQNIQPTRLGALASLFIAQHADSKT
jgi:hypothetical protein